FEETRREGVSFLPRRGPKRFLGDGRLTAVELRRVVSVFDANGRGTWVRADAALYTEVPSLATPMGSHLIAHVDAASRDADPDARAGTPQTLAEVFGPAGPPGGAR